jgi:DNA polymerase III alpha subunit (gram-positive type)
MSTEVRELVFLDTESTGLEPDTDALWELSYAIGNGQVETLYFGVTKVPPFIDELTKFTARGIHLKPRSPEEEFSKFLSVTKDKTMVSANPPHDKGFLRRAGLFEFHYRMLDIESYAMHALNLNFVPGMKDIFEILKEHGYDLPRPDHSAAGDVISMRRMYYILLNDFPAEKR